jgi:uncharacterized protein
MSEPLAPPLPATYVELSRLDTQIDQLQHRRSHLPELAERRRVDGEIAALDQQRTAHQHARNGIDARLASGDTERGQLDTKIAALEQRLRNLAVVREAEAVQHEIAVLRARLGELDDTDLALLDELEAIDVEDRRLVAVRDDLTTELADAAAAHDRADADVGAELDAVRAARSDVAARLGESDLATYERQRATHGAVAIATLSGLVCQPCNVTQPRGEVDRIRALPPDEMAECEQCGRWLVAGS